MRPHWLWWICCWYSGFVTAAEPYRIQLLPQTCVISEKNPVCQIDLTVQIAGGEAAQVCVHIDTAASQCFWYEPPQSPELVIAVHSDQDLNVQLTRADGLMLQQTVLQLMRFQNQKKRHKRGYVWSIL